MTFFEWMKIQIKRDDPIGDLANDMIDDVRLNGNDPFMKLYTTRQWQKRIEVMSADWIMRVRKVFDNAVSEYHIAQGCIK